MVNIQNKLELCFKLNASKLVIWPSAKQQNSIMFKWPFLILCLCDDVRIRFYGQISFGWNWFVPRSDEKYSTYIFRVQRPSFVLSPLSLWHFDSQLFSLLFFSSWIKQVKCKMQKILLIFKRVSKRTNTLILNCPVAKSIPAV